MGSGAPIRLHIFLYFGFLLPLSRLFCLACSYYVGIVLVDVPSGGMAYNPALPREPWIVLPVKPGEGDDIGVGHIDEGPIDGHGWPLGWRSSIEGPYHQGPVEIAALGRSRALSEPMLRVLVWPRAGGLGAVAVLPLWAGGIWAHGNVRHKSSARAVCRTP